VAISETSLGQFFTVIAFIAIVYAIAVLILANKKTSGDTQ